MDPPYTNEETMIEELKHISPLGSGEHCGLDFIFKCYVVQNEKNDDGTISREIMKI